MLTYSTLTSHDDWTAHSFSQELTDAEQALGALGEKWSLRCRGQTGQGGLHIRTWYVAVTVQEPHSGQLALGGLRKNPATYDL